MVDAVGEDRPQLLQDITDLTNAQVREAALNAGFNLADIEHVGSRKGMAGKQVSRQDLLTHMVENGVRPEEIPALAAQEMQKIPVDELRQGDTFIDKNGEPRRIVEITPDGKIRTADGTALTYEGGIQIRGELNSPRALLAHGGKFIPGPGEGFSERGGPLKDMVSDKEAEGNARRKGAREEDIGLPKNEAKELTDENGVKHFYGPLSDDQFIQRWLNQLGPEQIARWRDWYPEVGRRFKEWFGDGPQAARKLMAWLVSQKNTSPAGGLQNVFRTEDILKGQRRVLSGGLAEDQIRAMLLGDKPTEGLGAKLHDFVDSAYQRLTRTWMGDRPEGGAPAVIDVHSARGTGFFDKTLIKFIENKFGKDAARGLVADLKGAPSETQYERGSERYNQLAKALNERKFMGGGWTPDQVQAVDWAAMGKQLGRDMELPEAIFDKNIRRIAYEINPHPNSPLGKMIDWSKLTHDQAMQVTRAAAERVMKIVAKEAGGNIARQIFGPGGWLDKGATTTIEQGPLRGARYSSPTASVSPSAQLDLLSSPEAAERVGLLLGRLLNQGEVLISRGLKSGNGHAFEIRETGGTVKLSEPSVLHAFWEKFGELYPKAEGFSPVRDPDGTVGIQILKKAGHISEVEAKKMHAAAEDAAEAVGIGRDNIETEHAPAKVQSLTNDWAKSPNGEDYHARLKEIGRIGILKRITEEYAPAVERIVKQEYRRALRSGGGG